MGHFVRPDVPLRNYSLTHSLVRPEPTLEFYDLTNQPVYMNSKTNDTVVITPCDDVERGRCSTVLVDCSRC